MDSIHYAWAWGASRILDNFTTAAAAAAATAARRTDMGKVDRVGHSRGGKTSLWAAAQDGRFAATWSL
jgi:dipeptidyl aminopeptidase/acylaminoacyl peptidase